MDIFNKSPNLSPILEDTNIGGYTNKSTEEKNNDIEFLEKGIAPERAKEVIKNNVFMVEDTPRQIESAKNVLGNIECLGDLKSSLENIENNPEKFKMIITDLFYPIGEIKKEYRAEFYSKFGDALENAIKPVLDNKFAREEIKEYIQQIKEGTANEIPSGILLGLYALLEKNIPSVIVTSESHHGAKVEPINVLLNYKPRYPLGVELQLIDGTAENGDKKWDYALFECFKKIEGWNNYTSTWKQDSDFYLKQRKQKLDQLKEDPYFLNSGFIELVKNLPKYFDIQLKN